MSKPRFSSLEAAEACGFAEIQENVSAAFRNRFDVRVERIAGAVTILAPGSDMAALNRVWLPGTADLVTPSVLETISEHARIVGTKRLFAHCPAWASSPEMMGQYGFQLRPSWFKFARQPSTSLPADPVRVERIAPSDAATFGQVAAAANEVEIWMADAFNSTVGLPGWSHYLALDAQTPIAAGAMFVRDGYAWCCFGATLPAHRRRGAQLALLHRRTRDAAKAGCDWIVSETRGDNPASTRNMQRAGFEVIYERPNYTADLRPADA